MRGWFAGAVGVVALLQCPLGCSSSSSPSSSDTPVAQNQVRGAYRATNDGGVREINFYDSTHYSLWRSPCAEGQQPAAGSNRCLETGSYVLDDARTELSLTDAATGQKTSMPFRALRVDTSLTGASMKTPTLALEALTGDGLGGGDGGVQLYQSKGPLIATFQAGPQSFENETSNGVDYSFARPSPQGLHDAGYTFAARYLSHDSGKNLTADEAQALSAAGVDIVSNWESTADRALEGYDAGVADANDAQGQATGAGMPGDRPIYFSVDFDAAEDQQGAINAYFDGAASVLGVQRVGAYGGYYVIKRLFDAGKITWGWQAFAWSGGQWDSRAQLRQIQNDVDIAGGACDIDQSQTGDFGQWRRQ